MRTLLASSFLLVLASSAAAQAQDTYDRFYRAIRTDNLADLKQMLDKGESPNVTGSQKMTPLHDAALIGSAGALRLLLDHGAKIDAQNSNGYTALIYATRSLEKTHLLLEHGANLTLTGGGPPPLGAEMSALMQAAGRKGNVPVVRALLDKGSEVQFADNRGGTALTAAAFAGDLETMVLLLEKGADVNPAMTSNLSFSPLMSAVLSRQPAAVKLLLAKGAKVNAASALDKPNKVKNGDIDLGGWTALHLAVPYGPPEIVKLLLDAGADVNAKDIQGMTPLMWSVSSDYQNPEITKLLLARGADANIKSRDGLTALNYAQRLGASAGIAALGGIPEKSADRVTKPEGVADAKTSLTRAMGVLDRHASNSFLQIGGCVACHAQLATQIAASSAMKVVPLSDENAKLIQMLKPGIEIPALQGASGEGVVLGLEGRRPMPDVSERAMDYAVASLVAAQNEDGSWHGTVPRTPIQDGDFSQTGLSARALASYAPPAMKADVAKRLAKSRQWLLNAKPVTTENFAMKMLGLAATGASSTEIAKAGKALIAEQRPDGGWAQRKELSSDAYATGIALWALFDAGQLQPTDAAFERGVKYLVSTQKDDGSWYVKSRAVIRLQPYFESGFPYEHDQWISSMATGWAAKALAVSLTEPSKIVAARK